MKEKLHHEVSGVKIAEPKLANGVVAARRMEPVWSNVILFTTMHLIAFYGLVELLVRRNITLKQTAIIYLWIWFSDTLGSIVGAHRYWTHHSFKAKLPLQILLVIAQTFSMQNSIYVWVRDHRSHHKFCETPGDPHNAKFGVFFSHIGWLLCKKQPEVRNQSKTINMDDMKSDPLVMWQYKNYYYLVFLVFFIFPTTFFSYAFGWSYWYAFVIGGVTRYIISLHISWLLNSAGHLMGTKPYNKNGCARESLFLKHFGSSGEGYHNYHHAFPWDYKSSEWEGFYFNSAKAFIDICAYFGLAYDLKTVPVDIIKRKVLKDGDGTHCVWGWGDSDMTKQDVLDTQIIYKKE